MWKPSRYKPKTVEAMQFVYSEDGIASMKEWVGGGKSQKDRHPYAIGIFILPSSLVVEEGDYVLKTTEGFRIVCDELFKQLFSVEQENSVDNSYEP